MAATAAPTPYSPRTTNHDHAPRPTNHASRTKPRIGAIRALGGYPPIVDPQPSIVVPRPLVVAPQRLIVVPRPLIAAPRLLIVAPRPLIVAPLLLIVAPQPLIVAPQPLIVAPRPLMVVPRLLMVAPRPYAPSWASALSGCRHAVQFPQHSGLLCKPLPTVPSSASYPYLYGYRLIRKCTDAGKRATLPHRLNGPNQRLGTA
jgi:hypothetical protein